MKSKNVKTYILPLIGTVEFDVNTLLTLSASIIFAIVVFAFWVFLLYQKPEFNGAISWKPFNETNVGALVSTLLFISLASQSTLEVFVSNFRKFKKLQLQQELDRTKLKVTEIEADLSKLDTLEQRQSKTQSLEAAENAQSEAQNNLDRYRSNTRKIVSIIALLLGFCIATAGVRVLQPFVQIAATGSGSIQVSPDPLQESFFHALDIILTAALIAGGSEGINRLTRVYNALTASAAEKAAQ